MQVDSLRMKTDQAWKKMQDIVMMAAKNKVKMKNDKLIKTQIFSLFTKNAQIGLLFWDLRMVKLWEFTWTENMQIKRQIY